MSVFDYPYSVITYQQLRRRSEDRDDVDELSDDSEGSSPSLAREGKGWWRASVPLEESYSDVDEGQEWRYQIIGEEVDGFGKVWCVSSAPLLFSRSFNCSILRYEV